MMLIVLGIGTPAQATLIDCGVDPLGDHLIYDTDGDITWYDALSVVLPLYLYDDQRLQQFTPGKENLW
jgi:hypothetical protein